jgi:diguanylate cyclase (GGDEF)-like protein/PAS domain S-box-containing protein
MVRAPWERFLIAGLATVFIGALLGPTFLALAGQAIGWSAMVLTVRRTRGLPRSRRLPYLFFATAAALFLIAGIAHEVHQLLADQSDLFPSAGDVVYLAGYVMLLVAGLLLVRTRGNGGNLDDLVDAVMVAVATGLVVWAFVMAPYVRDTAFPLDERVLNTVYSTLSLVMVGLVARIAVGPGRRNPSYYFLAGAAGLILLTDVLATLESTGRSDLGHLTGIVGPLSFVFAGVAVLHPSMTELTEKPAQHEVQLTRRRQAMLAVALLISPMVLIWQMAHDEPIDLPVVVTGFVVLSLLVLVRLSSLVRVRDRAVARERILHRAGGDFVAATTATEMYARALDAVLAFAGDAGSTRASVLLNVGEQPAIVASVGQRSSEALGVFPKRGRLSPEVHVALADRRVVTTTSRLPVDLASDTPEKAVTIIPLVSQNESRSAIVVSSATPLPPHALEGLEALSSELSLAIESALLNEERLRRESEKRFRALVENSSDLVMVVGQDGLVSFCSPAAERLLGLPDGYFVGRPPFERVHDDDGWRVPPLMDHPSVPDDTTEPLELRLAHADGAYRWFEVLTKDLRSDPSVGGIVVNAREITDRKRAEQRLARSEARFRALVQNSSDVVAVVDSHGVFTYVSPAVTQVLGYRADDLVGTNVFDLVGDDIATRVQEHPEMLEMDPFPQTSVEVHLLDSGGMPRTMDVTIADLRREPAVGGIVLNARDVSVRKELEHDLRHQALHDALTGLGNRTLFTERVTTALDSVDDGARVAVLFVDLDDFKTVNDSLGHAAGDQLLVAVAGRLHECLRVSDVAARLGGDEFGVLLPASYGETEAQGVADRILDALRAPLEIQGRAIELTASLGIALGGRGDGTGEVLLRNADVAMYLAKGRGKDRYEVFREEMHTNVFERLELKADLGRAIDDNQLLLHYQPIVDLATGRITKVEALVRWRHPRRGLLSPANFIPLAEETGLIIPLGRWVMNEAVAQLRRWSDLPSAHDLALSVNLSVRQLQQDGIVQEVLGVLDRHRVPPRHLIVEITESMLVEDRSDAAQRIDALRSTGVSLAVDDFGTGYSSLATIQRFGVDYIKIDRSFVERLGAGGEPDLVRTIIDLAGQLGARTVAEGIEGNSQLVQLRELGCDLGQGFYFAEPLTPEAFERLLVPDATGDEVVLPEPTPEREPDPV